MMFFYRPRADKSAITLKSDLITTRPARVVRAIHVEGDSNNLKMRFDFESNVEIERRHVLVATTVDPAIKLVI